MKTLLTQDGRPRLMLRLAEFTKTQAILLFVLWIIFNFLRVEYRINRALIGDEGYQVNFMASFSLNSRGFSEYLKRLEGDPGRLPLSDYIVCWPLARLFPDNKYVLSVPYVLMSNLFFWFFARVNWEELLMPAKEVLEGFSFKWVNVISILLFTFNKTSIEHAFEIRNWGTLCLQGILAFLLAWKMLHNAFRWRYLLGCLLILNYHFYGVIMLGVSLIYHGAVIAYSKREERSLRENMLACISAYGSYALACVITAPLYIKYGGRGLIVNTHEWIHPGWSSVRQVFSLYFHNSLLRNVSLPFLVFGTVWMMRRWYTPIVFMFLMVVVPSLVIYRLDLWASYWFLQRQFLWAMPYWGVFVACSICSCLVMLNNIRKFPC